MEPTFFASFDGTRLAYRTQGQGRVVIPLHGLFSSATVNWIKFGHADAIAAAGFRVVMPDLRAHGDSDAPHAAAAYPPDVLIRDLDALIAHLGVDDVDLGGFSLGARTTARAIVDGARPGRAVLAGIAGAGLCGFADPAPAVTLRRQ